MLDYAACAIINRKLLACGVFRVDTHVEKVQQVQNVNLVEVLSISFKV